MGSTQTGTKNSADIFEVIEDNGILNLLSGTGGAFSVSQVAPTHVSQFAKAIDELKAAAVQGLNASEFFSKMKEKTVLLQKESEYKINNFRHPSKPGVPKGSRLDSFGRASITDSNGLVIGDSSIRIPIKSKNR